MCIYGHTSRVTFPQAKWRGGTGNRHLSQGQTRTHQAGRARWATLFSDTLARILLTKASTSSLSSPEQARVKQEAAPAQGWAWKPQLSNVWLYPSISSHGPSTQTEGLTSWRMSSSLGMMESSRVSSLQRQGEGQAEATAEGSGCRAQAGGGESRCLPATLEAGRPDTHLFWIRPMTWEYVFPMTLSPFTFTSRSPRDKGWDHM